MRVPSLAIALAIALLGHQTAVRGEDRLIQSIPASDRVEYCIYWRGIDAVREAYEGTILAKAVKQTTLDEFALQLVGELLMRNAGHPGEKARQRVEEVIRYAARKGVLLIGFNIGSALLFRVTDQTDQEILERGLRVFAPDAQPTSVDGLTVMTSSGGQRGPRVTWFRQDDVLVVCDLPPYSQIIPMMRTSIMEKQGGPPGLQSPLLHFQNSPAAIGLVTVNLKGTEIEPLKRSQYLSIQTDFDGPRTRTRLVLHLPRPRDPVLRLLASWRLDSFDVLPPLPPRTTSAVLMRIDATQFVKMLADLTAADEGGDPNEILERWAEQTREALGIDLLGTVLPAIGEHVVLASSPPPFPGMLDVSLFLELKDAKPVRKALPNCVDAFARLANARIQQTEFEAVRLYTVISPDIPLTPTAGVVDKWFLLATTAPSARRHIAALRGKIPRWQLPPAATRMTALALKNRPVLLSLTDSEATIQMLGPLWNVAIRASNLELDPTIVPGAELVPLLTGQWATVSVYFTDETLEAEAVEPIPGASVIGSAATPVLSGLLLPAVQQARAAAARVACMQNLRTIAIALHKYHAVHGRFPPPVLYSPDGKTPYSWRVALLPYLDEGDLYKRYHLDEPWDGPNNIKLLEEIPDAYRCPVAKSDPTHTCYAVVVGAKTAFPPRKRGLGLRDIVDGTSLTIAVVEVPGGIPWTEPRDVPFESALQQVGSNHPEGFNVVFLDGSVRFIPLNWLTEDRLRALLTVSGREPIKLP